MKFKLFLESVHYVYNSSRKKWEPNVHSINIPTDIIVTIYDSKKLVDVDNSSYNNLLFYKSVQDLVKLEPRIANYNLYFDGYKTKETVTEFINSGIKDILPEFVYTGTSEKRYEDIRVNGLVPRAITGSKPTHGHFKPSVADNVYMSVTPGNTVRFAARDASRDGSSPLILKISTENFMSSKLMPDEDSKSHSWQDSISMIANFAYRGTIRPQDIEPYMILKDGEWKHYNKGI